MQDNQLKKYVDNEMKQIEIPREVHKELKLEAADRDIPMKTLASDILEGWLDSHRPNWKQTDKEKEKEKEKNGEWTGEERRG